METALPDLIRYTVIDQMYSPHFSMGQCLPQHCKADLASDESFNTEGTEGMIGTASKIKFQVSFWSETLVYVTVHTR